MRFSITLWGAVGISFLLMIGIIFGKDIIGFIEYVIKMMWRGE